MWYKPKNFSLYEVLPQKFHEEMFKVYGDRLWTIFDDRIKQAAQGIRDLHGKMLGNTWWSPALVNVYGHYESRGYRPHDDDDVLKKECPTYGNISQHRFGRAFDFVPLEKSAEEIRKHMKEYPDHPAYEGITRVEETLRGKQISWLHIDCADTGEKEIVFLKL